jgi:hypothetical protein
MVLNMKLLITYSRNSSLLWNLMLDFRPQNCPLLVSTLTQTNPVHIFVIHFFEIGSNIILRPTPWSYLTFRIPDQNFVSNYCRIVLK